MSRRMDITLRELPVYPLYDEMLVCVLRDAVYKT